MTDWLKDIQSMGRGIRNGEMTVVMASSRSGKSMILDMESKGIEPTFQSGLIRHFTKQHWCHNAETDKWTYHNMRPRHEYIATSDQIIIRGEDGKFYWYKDRHSGRQHELNEQELKDLTFVLLGAEHIEPMETYWVDISKFRSKQAGVGTNLCNEIVIK